jgi:hypothetical protein
MEPEEQRPEPAGEPAEAAAAEQTPEEFAQELESDPAYNPTDPTLKAEKGG